MAAIAIRTGIGPLENDPDCGRKTIPRKVWTPRAPHRVPRRPETKGGQHKQKPCPRKITNWLSGEKQKGLATGTQTCAHPRVQPQMGTRTKSKKYNFPIGYLFHVDHFTCFVFLIAKKPVLFVSYGPPTSDRATSNLPFTVDKDTQKCYL